MLALFTIFNLSENLIICRMETLETEAIYMYSSYTLEVMFCEFRIIRVTRNEFQVMKFYIAPSSIVMRFNLIQNLIYSGKIIQHTIICGTI